MIDTDTLRLPLDISLGAIGGPERQTDVTTLGSGEEKRNQRWRRSRRRYEAGYGVKTLASLHEIIALFETVRGRLHTFRFRDPLDWKSCPPDDEIDAMDQPVGTGNGTTATFALTKLYGHGAQAYARPIKRPVAGSVIVAVDGTVLPATVDAVAGTITLGTPPPPGARITAGFAFDVPVRFDTDRLAISASHFEAGEIPNIPLLEVLS